MKMEELKENLKRDFDIDIRLKLNEKFTFKGQTLQISRYYNWCYVHLPTMKGLAFHTYYDLFNYLEKLNTQKEFTVKKKVK